MKQKTNDEVNPSFLSEKISQELSIVYTEEIRIQSEND